MRTKYMITLVAIFVGVLLPWCFSEPTPEPHDSWIKLVKGDFHVVLDAFSQRENAIPWLRLTLREDSTKGQTNTEDLSNTLLQRLSQYSKYLPELASGKGDAVSHTVAQLQDMRDRIVSTGGYVNFVLADMINRVVFACLAQQLIHDRRVDSHVQAQIDRANRFEIPISLWKQMLEVESGRSLRLDLPRDDENPLPGFLALLSNITGEASVEMAFVHAQVSSHCDLLQERNFPALIAAYMKTDSLIHLSLPLLALYVKNNPSFSTTDDYSQVKTALSSVARREKVGSGMNPYRQSSLAEVSRLLQASSLSTLGTIAGIANNARMGSQVRLSVEVELRKSLEAIDSVKQQIALMEGLKPDDVIPMNKIEVFMGRQMPIPPDGGEYQVGRVDEKPRFVWSDGQIISAGSGVNPENKK